MQCIGPDSRFAFPDLVIGVAPDVTEQIPGRILVELAKEDVVKVEWVSASPPVLRFAISYIISDHFGADDDDERTQQVNARSSLKFLAQIIRRRSE